VATKETTQQRRDNKKKVKGGNKRKMPHNEDGGVETKKAKVAVPPKASHNKKANKTNAKVTKPRRARTLATDA